MMSHCFSEVQKLYSNLKQQKEPLFFTRCLLELLKSLLEDALEIKSIDRFKKGLDKHMEDMSIVCY